MLGTRSFCRSPTVSARPSPQESGAFEAGVVPSLGGQPSRNRLLPMFLGDVLVPLAKCPVGPSSVAGAGGTGAQGPPTALAAQPRVTSAARICGAPPPKPPEAFSLLHVTSPPGAGGWTWSVPRQLGWHLWGGLLQPHTHPAWDGLVPFPSEPANTVPGSRETVQIRGFRPGAGGGLRVLGRPAAHLALAASSGPWRRLPAPQPKLVSGGCIVLSCVEQTQACGWPQRSELGGDARTQPWRRGPGSEGRARGGWRSPLARSFSVLMSGLRLRAPVL